MIVWLAMNGCYGYGKAYMGDFGVRSFSTKEEASEYIVSEIVKRYSGVALSNPGSYQNPDDPDRMNELLTEFRGNDYTHGEDRDGECEFSIEKREITLPPLISFDRALSLISSGRARTTGIEYTPGSEVAIITLSTPEGSYRVISRYDQQRNMIYPVQ